MALTRMFVLLALLAPMLLLPALAVADTDEVKIPEKFDAVPTGDAGAYRVIQGSVLE